MTFRRFDYWASKPKRKPARTPYVTPPAPVYIYKDLTASLVDTFPPKMLTRAGGSAGVYATDAIIPFPPQLLNGAGQAKGVYATDTVTRFPVGLNSGAVAVVLPKDPYFAYVVALLHFDGLDAGTTFIDEKGHSVITNGATTKTAQSKFGGSSGYFGGNSYASIPANADFNLDSTYTIEYWIRPNSIAANFGIIHRGYYSTYTNSWSGLAFSHRWLGSTLRVYFYGTINANEQYVDVPNALIANVWTHVAVVRNGLYGYVFINGVLSASISALNTPSHSGNDLKLGMWDYDSVAPPEYFSGYIDDLRITKGVARYTSAFTPPILAFPNLQMGVPADPNFNSVTALLHFEGAAGSSLVTDVKSSNSWTTTYTLSNAQAKFGSTSLRLLGPTGISLGAIGLAPFAVGNGDFAVEAWVYPTQAYNTSIIAIGDGDSATIQGSSWIFYISNVGTTTDSYSFDGSHQCISPAPPVNQWSHVAYTRVANVLRTFLNGVNVGTTQITSAVNSGAGPHPASIGGTNNGYAPFVGYMDEFRMTVGVGRYSANFVPPVLAFPNTL